MKDDRKRKRPIGLINNTIFFFCGLDVERLTAEMNLGHVHDVCRGFSTSMAKLKFKQFFDKQLMKTKEKYVC